MKLIFLICLTFCFTFHFQAQRAYKKKVHARIVPFLRKGDSYHNIQKSEVDTIEFRFHDFSREEFTTIFQTAVLKLCDKKDTIQESKLLNTFSDIQQKNFRKKGKVKRRKKMAALKLFRKKLPLFRCHFSELYHEVIEIPISTKRANTYFDNKDGRSPYHFYYQKSQGKGEPVKVMTEKELRDRLMKELLMLSTVRTHGMKQLKFIGYSAKLIARGKKFPYLRIVIYFGGKKLKKIEQKFGTEQIRQR